MLTGGLLKFTVVPAKQPPPATVTMVAGGGDLVLDLLLSFVPYLNEITHRLSPYV